MARAAVGPGDLLRAMADLIGYGDGSAYIPGDAMIDEGGYEVEGSVVEFGLKGRLKKGVNRKAREAFGQALNALERAR